MAAGNPAPQWHTPDEASWSQPTTAGLPPNLSMNAAESQASASLSQRSMGWHGPAPDPSSALSLSQRAHQESAQSLGHIPPQQAHTTTTATASPFQTPTPPAASASPTDSADSSDAPPELDRLVNRMVFAVLDKLNDETFVEKFTKSRELLNDNRQLATQIQQQLRQQQQHTEELNYYQTELTKYKKLFGSFYFKIEG